MVAAKLDQSRVLVTKFHQNRSMLKGRSAGQRQTDRQTNSAENKGPSGLQSGQQTRLKIMALQVCNRATTQTDRHTHGQIDVLITIIYHRSHG